MIRVLIVDDQNLIRLGLNELLKSSLKLEIVGTAKDGQTAIDLVESLKPDVVLMDIEMPNMNGIVATQTISQQFPATKVIILSSHEKLEYRIEAFQAGAEGYLLKDTLAENLEQAIYLVHQGQSQISSKLLKGLFLQSSNTQALDSTKADELVLVGSQSIPTKLERSQNNGKLLHDNNWELFSPELTSNLDVRNDNLEELKPNGNSDRSSNLSPNLSETRSPEEAVAEEANEDELFINETNETNETVGQTKAEKRQAKGFSFKSSRQFWLWILLVISLLLGAKTLFFSQEDKTSPAASAETETVPQAVAALGYLEPEAEVIKLSAPTFAEGTRVEEMLVKRGDRVTKGQTVAILDNRDRLQAALSKAEQEVSLAQNRLAQVEAGAKNGDIMAQKAKFEGTQAELSGQINVQEATIADLKAQRQGEMNAQQATLARVSAELQNAERECQRYESLYTEGTVSSSKKESICLQQTTTKEQLAEAKANLTKTDNTLSQQISQAVANLERTKTTLNNQINEAEASLEAISEVRSVDLNVAQTELKIAKAAVTKAKADLALAFVKSPIDGQILKINTLPGEVVASSEGVVELGNTEKMYVVAEVYETDIARIRVGQTATISGRGVSEKMKGTVDDIGLQIGTNDVLGTDPVADADARVVEVKISLQPEDSKRVANLTNLQVNVVIDTSQ